MSCAWHHPTWRSTRCPDRQEEPVPPGQGETGECAVVSQPCVPGPLPGGIVISGTNRAGLLARGGATHLPRPRFAAQWSSGSPHRPAHGWPGLSQWRGRAGLTPDFRKAPFVYVTTVRSYSASAVRATGRCGGPAGAGALGRAPAKAGQAGPGPAARTNGLRAVPCRPVQRVRRACGRPPRSGHGRCGASRRPDRGRSPRTRCRLRRRPGAGSRRGRHGSSRGSR
jgi:hypothetical protein